ncbi:hypothetical protein C627_01960 [Corynebacterium glutamicum ZL-6]|nr:hypothetical protein C628_01955 [[Brevibacterium] flavum ZL-1]ANR64384.1 hypothetical protein C627_01960 [Corynebacterium glutamicum ZL-6]PST77043.1 hypothetical protein I919_01985 [Corynebacterium glutamicum ZL-2]GAV96126.1 hypothetical protein CS176_0356 [Corynebacterium glutamicum]
MNILEQIIFFINTIVGYGLHAGSSASSNLSHTIGLF